MALPEHIEEARLRAVELLEQFGSLPADHLREQVLKLVPVFHSLREIGIRLQPNGEHESGQNRILRYFQVHAGRVLHTDELMVVSGITDYQRRIRDLRTKFGWNIASGVTIREMASAMDVTLDDGTDLLTMSPDEYILLSATQDLEAAHRWNVAKAIGELKIGGKAKMLKFLRANAGRPVSGEELRHVSGNNSEWARRVRELRTEEGWPIKTSSSGRPDLPVGMYLLEEDKQVQVHDRKIPDSVYVAVLVRDQYKCRKCDWSKDIQIPGDKRHLLELHHVMHHAAGGENSADNLVTLCNVHHDDVHRLKLEGAGFWSWLETA